jgi:hypothetical protein
MYRSAVLVALLALAVLAPQGLAEKKEVKLVKE